LIGKALTKSDVAARRTGSAWRSIPLKRQEIDPASNNAGFAMKCQEKYRLSGGFVKTVFSSDKLLDKSASLK
jgi:hypothetical protein